MIVMKFGGTSVGTPDRMKSVAELVNRPEPTLAVLSALSGTTDTLSNIAALLHDKQKTSAQEVIQTLKQHYYDFVEELFEGLDKMQKEALIGVVDSHFDFIWSFTLDMFTHHEEKAILAQGELMSTTIFHSYLTAKVQNSCFLNALDFMRTDKDGEPDYYYIQHNLQKELQFNQNHNLYITQGYICRNVYGEIDNLKRGGSDYSAALIGAALQVDQVEIWTDIDGMHNNDPRVVKNTQPIRNLSYDEAAELAYFGAKILHPASIWPAQEKNIPVYLKNTIHPSDEGTKISKESVKGKVKSIAAKDGISAIKIKSGRMLLAYGFLRRVFEVFERFKTPIDMITTSEVAVSVTIDDTSRLTEIVEDLQVYGKVEVQHNMSIICIVGDFLAEHKGYAKRIFDALESVPIRMISYGGSKNNISLLVDQSDKKEALNLLNSKIFGL